MNMQKDAIFGGVRRVRYSSQSLKRAIRKSDYYEKHLGKKAYKTTELGIKQLDQMKNYCKELLEKI